MHRRGYKVVKDYPRLEGCQKVENSRKSVDCEQNFIYLCHLLHCCIIYKLPANGKINSMSGRIDLRNKNDIFSLYNKILTISSNGCILIFHKCINEIFLFH